MKFACAFLLVILLVTLFAAVEAPPGDKLALVPKGAIVLWPANAPIPDGWKALPAELTTNLTWVTKL